MKRPNLLLIAAGLLPLLGIILRLKENGTVRERRVHFAHRYGMRLRAEQLERGQNERDQPANLQQHGILRGGIRRSDRKASWHGD